MLVQWLQRFEPFAAQDTAERATVARHTRVLELPAGRRFVTAGRRAPGSWFLWKGAVCVRANDGTEVRVCHDSATARRAVVDHGGTGGGAVRAAVTLVPSVILYVDLRPIEFLLNPRPLGGYPVADVADVAQPDWAHRFLATGFARRLPPATLQALFRGLTPVRYEAGRRVVSEGESGDAFYVVRSGSARVFRQRLEVDLAPGDCFGADALLSGTPRNASVAMVQDGTLLRLPAAYFRLLIETPLIERVVSPPHAAVRLEADRLPATGVELRRVLARLDTQPRYAVVGRDEGRARLTVFLLGERGVDAVWVE